jgi:hypothetical protein
VTASVSGVNLDTRRISHIAKSRWQGPVLLRLLATHTWAVFCLHNWRIFAFEAVRVGPVEQSGQQASLGRRLRRYRRTSNSEDDDRLPHRETNNVHVDGRAGPPIT